MWNVCVVEKQESCGRDGEEGEGRDKEEQSAQIRLDGRAGGEDLDWPEGSGLEAMSVINWYS